MRLITVKDRHGIVAEGALHKGSMYGTDTSIAVLKYFLFSPSLLHNSWNMAYFGTLDIYIEYAVAALVVSLKHKSRFPGEKKSVSPTYTFLSRPLRNGFADRRGSYPREIIRMKHAKSPANIKEKLTMEVHFVCSNLCFS